MKHSVLRNPAFRKEFKTIEEGSEVMEKMILTNDECVHQVLPLVPDHNNNSLDDCLASDPGHKSSILLPHVMRTEFLHNCTNLCYLLILPMNLQKDK